MQPLPSLAVLFGKCALDEMLLRLAALVCSSERNRPQTTFLFPFPLRIKYHVFCYHPQLKEEGEKICVLSQLRTLGAGRSLTSSGYVSEDFLHFLWQQLGGMFSYRRTISSRTRRTFHSPQERKGAPASHNSFPQQLWLEDGIETSFL